MPPRDDALGGAPREAELTRRRLTSFDARYDALHSWRLSADLSVGADAVLVNALKGLREAHEHELAAATARVGELCDALEIIEGDCLRNSDDPATTLFHIYATARAVLRQEGET